MEGYTIVGKRIPQMDSGEKVSGEAKYTDDFTFPGVLHAKCLRSPLPHAKILNIDTSKAERLIGVKGVVTGKDTSGIPYNYIEVPGFPYFQDQLPLCMEKVRYIGDEVAAAAAKDEDIAEEALDLIRVDYEELPAVFDPKEAMEPGSPKIHEDGTVSILSGTSDIGQGSDTLLCQIVAEELGVELSKVRILSADTEITPIDPGSYSSMGTFTGGNAARKAAEDARNQIFGIAAERLEARAEDLTAKDGWIYVKGSPAKGISFSEIVRICFQEKGSFPMGKGYFRPELEYPNIVTGIGALSRTYSYGAQIAQAKLDDETGKLCVKALTIAHDCGLAINPMALEGQLEGSAVAGMGYALWEEVLYDRGQALNPNFRDYKIPTALDAPQVKAIPVQSIDPEGPFGAKECGEGTQISTAPAIANALYHASSIRIESLPLIPERILQAMEKD